MPLGSEPSPDGKAEVQATIQTKDSEIMPQSAMDGLHADPPEQLLDRVALHVVTRL